MKANFSDILMKAKAAADAKRQLKEEAQRAEEEKRRLQGEADAAIDAEDIDRYLSLKQQMERNDAAFLIRKRRLEKEAAPVSQEDAKAEWDKYVPGYEKALKKALADVNAKRSAYFKSYFEAVELQAEACEARENLCSMIGIVPEPMGGMCDSLFPMPTIPITSGAEGITLRGPIGVQDRDVAFLTSYMSSTPLEYTKNPSIMRILSVVNRKRSK